MSMIIPPIPLFEILLRKLRIPCKHPDLGLLRAQALSWKKRIEDLIMPLILALPSYALLKSTDALKTDKLLDGSYYREAMEFFNLVVEASGASLLRQRYTQLLDFHARDGHVVGDSLAGDRFLSLTVGLIAIQDITSLAPYLTDDQLPLGSISSVIGNLQDRVDIDFVRHYVNRGQLPGKLFCMMYNINQISLCEKIVVDDNADAYNHLTKDDPEGAVRALARVPYNPLSNIRSSIQSDVLLSAYELSLRHKHQVSALYTSEHTKLINPAFGFKLLKGKATEYTPLETIDHGLRSLPGYYDMLASPEYKNTALTQFGFLSRIQPELSAEQTVLLIKLMEDFEKSGIPRSDILILGTLSAADRAALKFEIDPANTSNQTDIEFAKKAAYLAMDADQKQALYLDVLLTHAAEYTDKPSNYQAKAKLRQIHHLMSKEPLSTLENLCTNGSQWHALYQLTGNKSYLEKVESLIEHTFSMDMGL